MSPGCRKTLPPPSALQEGVAVASSSPAEALWRGGAPPPPLPRSTALNVLGGSMGDPSPPCCLLGVQATVATTLAGAGAAGAKLATEDVVVAVSKSPAVLSALVEASETS